METKKFAVKAPEGADGVRSFEGYASTWTRTPDSYGDVVAKGAFADSLTALAESGKALPVLWLHDMWEPSAYVAKVVDIVEDDHGLRVKGEFFDDDPAALKVHRLIKERVVNEMSFAFDVVESADIEEAGVKVRELRKLDLHEVSIVPYGANPDTSIESVKTGIAALTRVAEKFASSVEEVAGNAEETPEAGNEESEAERNSKAEAKQRVKEAQENYRQIVGEEGDSK